MQVTTSQFSREAKDYVNRTEKKIILIGGQELARLMVDHGIGVQKSGLTVRGKWTWIILVKSNTFVG
jgi:restriction endonuclease Mrr